MGLIDIAGAFAFIATFLVGLIFGVLGCVAFIKFVGRMRGKSMVFNPYPRVQTNVCNHGQIMNNRTFESDNTNREAAAANPRTARAQQDSNSLLTVLERNGGGALAYEVQGPVNEKECDSQGQQPHALPYAVHAYLGELSDGASKPAVPNRSNDYSQISIVGGSGDANGMKSQVRWKQAKINPIHEAKLKLDAGPRNYSVLDKKMAYACLEPHTGEGATATRGDAVMARQNYSCLNH